MGPVRSKSLGILLVLTAIVLLAAITFLRPKPYPQADDGRFLAPLSDVAESQRPVSSGPPRALASGPATTEAAPRDSVPQLPPALAALQGVNPDHDITLDDASDATSTVRKPANIETSPVLVVDRSQEHRSGGAR